MPGPKKLKEIKFRPRTEAHDLAFKTKHVREFLTKGHSVRLVVMFRGRELAHTDIGAKLLQNIITAVSDVGVVNKLPAMNGRDMMVIVMPKHSLNDTIKEVKGLVGKIYEED